MGTPNIVITPLPRPNPFMATPQETMAVAESLQTDGIIPQGGTMPASPEGPNLYKPIPIQIRVARQGELFFPSASIGAGGYFPFFIEFEGPNIQSDNGVVVYSATPPVGVGSIFEGHRMPPGYSFYGLVAGLLADMLTQLPNAKWYMTPDGNVTRR